MNPDPQSPTSRTMRFHLTQSGISVAKSRRNSWQLNDCKELFLTIDCSVSLSKPSMAISKNIWSSTSLREVSIISYLLTPSKTRSLWRAYSCFLGAIQANPYITTIRLSKLSSPILGDFCEMIEEKSTIENLTIESTSGKPFDSYEIDMVSTALMLTGSRINVVMVFGRDEAQLFPKVLNALASSCTKHTFTAFWDIKQPTLHDSKYMEALNKFYQNPVKLQLTAKLLLGKESCLSGRFPYMEQSEIKVFKTFAYRALYEEKSFVNTLLIGSIFQHPFAEPHYRNTSVKTLRITIKMEQLVKAFATIASFVDLKALYTVFIRWMTWISLKRETTKWQEKKLEMNFVVC